MVGSREIAYNQDIQPGRKETDEIQGNSFLGILVEDRIIFPVKKSDTEVTLENDACHNQNRQYQSAYNAVMQVGLQLMNITFSVAVAD